VSVALEIKEVNGEMSVIVRDDENGSQVYPLKSIQHATLSVDSSYFGTSIIFNVSRLVSKAEAAKSGWVREANP
jgi:hypothetical protein